MYMYMYMYTQKEQKFYYILCSISIQRATAYFGIGPQIGDADLNGEMFWNNTLYVLLLSKLQDLYVCTCTCRGTAIATNNDFKLLLHPIFLTYIGTTLVQVQVHIHVYILCSKSELAYPPERLTLYSGLFIVALSRYLYMYL